MINWGDILVLAVLGLIVGAAIAKMYRDRKNGKHCSCGSCKGCSRSLQKEEPNCSCGCTKE